MAMAASEYLLGSTFTGSRAQRSWTATEKLQLLPNQSPGHFSVGYKVIDADGHRAFMKASDLSMFNAPGRDALQSLLAAATAHDFERRVLERCRGNNMDRVVTAIDFGDGEFVHQGVRDRIFFLIFELAQGDLRKHVERQDQFDLLWTVGAMSNFAVAVSQLHTGDIFHNDIKPANALLFEELQKIGDLGRATTPHIGVDHDNHLCAGDRRFAPPEQLYPAGLEHIRLDQFEKFKAGDLYNLGSLGYYLITGRMMTPEIIVRLRPEHKPRTVFGGWQDSYTIILPYWRSIFSELISEIMDSIPENYPDSLMPFLRQLIEMIVQLCEPDPLIRGYPRSIDAVSSQYSLQKYISSLDLLRQKVAIGVRRAK